MTTPNDKHTELLIRIDGKVDNLTSSFEEFKADTKEQQKKQDTKLSLHDAQFGEVNVRMTKQDGKIITGKFWTKFFAIVLGLGAIVGGLAAWVK